MTAYPIEFRGKIVRVPPLATLARTGAELGGLGWYARAHGELARYAAEVGENPQRVADVLALTSPRQTVARNVQLTRAYVETRSTAGMLPSVIAAVNHYEACGEIRGPKTSAFSRALMEENAVVVDVWMFRAMRLTHKTMTAKRYREAVAKVRRCARYVRMSPADCQSSVWCGIRTLYGYKSAGDLRFFGGERGKSEGTGCGNP